MLWIRKKATTAGIDAFYIVDVREFAQVENIPAASSGSVAAEIVKIEKSDNAVHKIEYSPNGMQN